MSILDEVTLDRLFRATKTIDLFGRKFTVRALTDLERNMRYRKAAFVRSTLAKKLDDTQSEDYIIEFGSAPELSDTDLREVITVFMEREATREASKAVQFKFDPYPDGADESEIDRVNKEREKSLAKMNKDRDKFAKQYLEDAKKRLASLSHDELLSEYLKAVRDSVLMAAYIEELNLQTLYMSLDGQLSYEDVRGLSAAAKQKLVDAVAEVDNINPLDLKLPVSMESSPAQSV